MAKTEGGIVHFHMRFSFRLIAALAILLFAVAFQGARQTPPPYKWKLPAGFPLPRVPAENPMSEAKVELGRYLFYDKRLSLNQTQSCASCHQQSRAFTDGRAKATGSTGQTHPRSSMTLLNVAYLPALTWANPTLTQLEAQALATPEERRDLVEFLQSLADSAVLADKRLSDPWRNQ